MPKTLSQTHQFDRSREPQKLHDDNAMNTAVWPVINLILQAAMLAVSATTHICILTVAN